MLRKGDLLGDRYLIEEQIGSGGMSLVYKARCTKIGRNVAVKVLRPEFVEDEEFVKRFKVEAQAAGSLSHPNVVNIYDMGMQEGIYYIVMEYIQGSTLKELIQEEKVFSLQKALLFSKQICEALVHAHSHHIVHCDIKPHNILVTQEGRVKVADFGIAKAVSASTISMTDQHAIGSVHYFSPEQARGGITDEKSDIYSLGVVMYEMLTGQIPFQGDSPVAVALKHIEGTFAPPSTVVEGIPRAVEDIILKAMQKNPRERYESAKEMANDIQKAIDTPEGDFVQKVLLDGSATMKFSKKEMDSISEFSNHSQIKSEHPKSNAKVGGETENSEDKRADVGLIIAAILTSLLIMGILSIGMFKYILPAVQADSRKIPSIVNMTEREAREHLKRFKLNLEIKEEIADSKYEKGRIISQIPQPGADLGDTKVVEVIISKGIEQVSVPKVVNLDINEAQKRLEQYGLHASIELIDSATYPKDTVIEQEPAEYTKVPVGETIKLVVSQGEKIEQVRIPNVQRISIEAAKKIIEVENNLLLSIKEEQESSEFEKGMIISQSPAPYEMVSPKTVVEVIVSSGKPETKLPNFVGRDIETVKKELNTLKIPHKIEQEYSNTVDENLIISQSQEAQTTVDKSKTLVIVVSRGKQNSSFKSFNVELPNDREQVNVKVIVDQEVRHQKIYSTAKPIQITIPGVGTQHVTIYLDDILYLDQDVAF